MIRTEKRDLIHALLLAQIKELTKQAPLELLYQIMNVICKYISSTEPHITIQEQNLINKKLLNQAANINTGNLKHFLSQAQNSVKKNRQFI